MFLFNDKYWPLQFPLLYGGGVASACVGALSFFTVLFDDYLF